MAQDTFKRKLPTILSAENNKTESRSLMLKIFILSRAASGLILSVEVGLWLQNLLEKPAYAEMSLKEIRCNSQNVVVRSPDHEDALIACEGARDAIEFLASQDLDVTSDIVIELLTSLPAPVSSSAGGCYLVSQQQVLILVYSEFRKFETWFGIPIDRSLYRSVVSHEVAHSVADCNFKIPNPTIQAKEYIAYVTQFATMEPVLRERILSQLRLRAAPARSQLDLDHHGHLLSLDSGAGQGRPGGGAFRTKRCTKPCTKTAYNRI